MKVISLLEDKQPLHLMWFSVYSRGSDWFLIVKVNLVLNPLLINKVHIS